MMRRSRLEHLAARRHALTAQSHALRSRLVEDGVSLRESVRTPQLAGAALRWVVRHPLALVAAVAGVIVVGPRRVLHMAAGAVGAWTFATRARSVAALVLRFLRRA
jgi:hypothetical protein